MKMGTPRENLEMKKGNKWKGEEERVGKPKVQKNEGGKRGPQRQAEKRPAP